MGCSIGITGVRGPMEMAVNYRAVLAGIAREYENDEDDQFSESFHWLRRHLCKDMRRPEDRRWLAEQMDDNPALAYTFRGGDEVGAHMSSVWMSIQGLCRFHATQVDLNDIHWTYSNTAMVLESMGSPKVGPCGTVDPTLLQRTWPEDGELWMRQEYIYNMAQAAIELGEKLCWG